MIVTKNPNGSFTITADKEELNYIHTALAYSIRLTMEKGNREAIEVAKDINNVRKTIEKHCKMKTEMEIFCKELNKLFDDASNN